MLFRKHLPDPDHSQPIRLRNRLHCHVLPDIQPDVWNHPAYFHIIYRYYMQSYYWSIRHLLTLYNSQKVMNRHPLYRFPNPQVQDLRSYRNSHRADIPQNSWLHSLVGQHLCFLFPPQPGDFLKNQPQINRHLCI